MPRPKSKQSLVSVLISTWTFHILLPTLCETKARLRWTFPPLPKRWTKSELPTVPGIGLRLRDCCSEDSSWEMLLWPSPHPHYSHSQMSVSLPALCHPSSQRSTSTSFRKKPPPLLKRGDFSSCYFVSVRCCHASLEAQSRPWGHSVLITLPH